MKTVIFFTAGSQATVVELARIALLMRTMNVLVERGDVAADVIYGSTAIKASDYVAGTVPTTYSGVTAITLPSDVGAEQFKVFPAAVTLDHAVPETQQLAALAASVDATTGLATMTNLAADATVTYASDSAHATVGSTGKVTAVTAGTANITATYTNDTAKTSVAATATTDVVTKTAHGYNQGDAIKFTALTGGTGLSTGTTYYVILIDANSFKLATSLANAMAGTAIDITADGSSGTTVRIPQTSTCVVTVS